MTLMSEDISVISFISISNTTFLDASNDDINPLGKKKSLVGMMWMVPKRYDGLSMPGPEICQSNDFSRVGVVAAEDLDVLQALNTITLKEIPTKKAKNLLIKRIGR